jgi:hypothetical protein
VTVLHAATTEGKHQAPTSKHQRKHQNPNIRLRGATARQAKHQQPSNLQTADDARVIANSVFTAEARRRRVGRHEHSTLHFEDGRGACFQGGGSGGSHDWRVVSFQLAAARSHERLTKFFASDLCGLGTSVRGFGNRVPGNCGPPASGERRALIRNDQTKTRVSVFESGRGVEPGACGSAFRSVRTGFGGCPLRAHSRGFASTPFC